MGYAKYVFAWTLFALVLGSAACSDEQSGFRNISEVPDDDAEMKAAIAKARETLPQFWEIFDQHKHGEANYSLKVKTIDKHGSEHFWLTNIERKDGKLIGTVDNDPEIVTNVKVRDRVEIPEKDISDWMYMRDGKMYGNRAIKPLLKTMSPEEVAAMKKLMAEP